MHMFAHCLLYVYEYVCRSPLTAGMCVQPLSTHTHTEADRSHSLWHVTAVHRDHRPLLLWGWREYEGKELLGVGAKNVVWRKTPAVTIRPTLCSHKDYIFKAKSSNTVTCKTLCPDVLIKLN